MIGHIGCLMEGEGENRFLGLITGVSHPNVATGLKLDKSGTLFHA